MMFDILSIEILYLSIGILTNSSLHYHAPTKTFFLALTFNIGLASEDIRDIVSHCLYLRISVQK
jgi:hypothetical protein